MKLPIRSWATGIIALSFCLSSLTGTAGAQEARSGSTDKDVRRTGLTRFVSTLDADAEQAEETAMRVDVVEQPPTDQRNDHYVSNRKPLTVSSLVLLPIRDVEPQGWVRKQLELQAEGFHGHLMAISRFLEKDENAWLDPEGHGTHGWEEVPYWLKGYSLCAYLLDDEEMIAEAKIWIEGAIASRRANGWFGPRDVESTVGSTKGKYDLWPNMIMLFCLQSYYDYSGDERVIDLMHDYFQWELQVPDEDFLPPYWQKVRAADNLASVYWLYNRTGDEWLLDLARKIDRNMARWDTRITSWHNVNIAQAFDSGAIFWQQSKQPRDLYSAQRNWETVRHLYGRVPGGMFGADENARRGYFGPRQAIETCGIVEAMLSDEQLLRITGDLKWADRCENATFNSLPAAVMADFSGLRYLTAPNQVRSDAEPKNPGIQNGGPMFLMSPHIHRCCQHNFGHGWPYYARHLWMATSDNGLAPAFYSDSKVTAKVGDGTEVTIDEATHYPFDEQVRFTLATEKPVRFPLYLRVPGWCENPEVKINGEAISVTAKPRTFIVVERQWSDGDEISLTLPMEIRVRRWDVNANSASVSRGPLTYSLEIGEDYRRHGGTEEWPAWEIWPTTPWNYGLVLNEENPAASFEVVHRDWPDNDMPFTHEGAPIALQAQGKRIPHWTVDRNGLVGKLGPSPVKSDQPTESITLIPMGAARLRIAAFPVIGNGPDAHRWQAPPPAPKPQVYSVTGSYHNGGDSFQAVRDGYLPESSSDQAISRLTFWPHKGTSEWVEAKFDKPRAVMAVRLYWFDDTGKGGGCGLPESWRLLYRDNGQWKPVSTSEKFGVKPNTFNTVHFEPVTTKALRLEIELKEGFSGGILEWEVMPLWTMAPGDN